MYDMIRLSIIVDTAIICTYGFSIYKDAYKQELIKKNFFSASCCANC